MWQRLRSCGGPVRLPRHHGRYASRLVSCGLGAVIDISAGGMRVRCEARPGVLPGQVMRFAIVSAEQRLEIAGRIAWLRRVSWRETQVGVQFLEVRPALADALVRFGDPAARDGSGAAARESGSGRVAART